MNPPLSTDPRVARARALYESVTKGATLTGDTARLALQLGNVLAAIDGKVASPYAPDPRNPLLPIFEQASQTLAYDPDTSAADLRANADQARAVLDAALRAAE